MCVFHSLFARIEWMLRTFAHLFFYLLFFFLWNSLLVGRSSNLFTNGGNCHVRTLILAAVAMELGMWSIALWYGLETLQLLVTPAAISAARFCCSTVVRASRFCRICGWEINFCRQFTWSIWLSCDMTTFFVSVTLLSCSSFCHRYRSSPAWSGSARWSISFY